MVTKRKAVPLFTTHHVWCVGCGVVCVCVCGVAHASLADPLAAPWSQPGLCWGSLPSIQVAFSCSFLCFFCRPGGPAPLRLLLTFLSSSIRPPSPFSLSNPALGRSSGYGVWAPLASVSVGRLCIHTPPRCLSPFLYFPVFASGSLAFCLLSSFFVSLCLCLSVLG